MEKNEVNELREQISKMSNKDVIKVIRDAFNKLETITLVEFESLQKMTTGSKILLNLYKGKPFSDELVEHIKKTYSHFKYETDLFKFKEYKVNWEAEDILETYSELSDKDLKSSLDVRKDVKADNYFKMSKFKSQYMFEIILPQFQLHLNRIDEVISTPNEPYGLLINNDDKHYYNMFEYNNNLKSLGSENLKHTNIFLDNLSNCDSNIKELLLDSIALMIRGVKMEKIIVLMGGKGIGKDTLIQLIGFMTNPLFTKSYQNDLDGYLHGDYNLDLSTKGCIYLNELSGSNLKSDLHSLKGDVTQKTKSVRQIYGKALTVTNINNIIIATNNENLHDYVESDERRFLFLNTFGKNKRFNELSEELGMSDKEFRNEIAKEAHSFRDFLRTRKVTVTDFNNKANNHIAGYSEDRVSKIIRAIAYNKFEELQEYASDFNVKLSDKELRLICTSQRISTKTLHDLLKLFKPSLKKSELKGAYDKLISRLFRKMKNATDKQFVLQWNPKDHTFNDGDYDKTKFLSTFYTKIYEEEVNEGDVDDNAFDFLK